MLQYLQNSIQSKSLRSSVPLHVQWCLVSFGIYSVVHLRTRRRFGLERCRVRCLMRPRFLRWAGHIAAPAAVWRVKRSRLGFDLLMATRLRLLAAAKRYWRWKVRRDQKGEH